MPEKSERITIMMA